MSRLGEGAVNGYACMRSYLNIDFETMFIDFEPTRRGNAEWICITSYRKHRSLNDFYWFRASGMSNGFAGSLTKTSIFKRFSLISSPGSGKWIRMTSYKNIDFWTMFIDFEPREWQMDSHNVLPKHHFLDDFYWYRALGVANGFAWHLTKTSILKRFSLISSLGNVKWIRMTSYLEDLPKHRFFNDFHWFRDPGVANGFA